MRIFKGSRAQSFFSLLILLVLFVSASGLLLRYPDAGFAAGTQTEPNLKVAFIGDQGLGSNATAVLQLIKDEGADMVLHQGDLDYVDDPAAWDAQIDSVLGANFPYFTSMGNHDKTKWDGAGGYQEKIQARINRVGATCTGDIGVQSSCTFKGLFFIQAAPGDRGSGHDIYIRDQLAADNSIWSVCGWHRNMTAMQVGSKGNDTGWGVYEECRAGGAITATAHEHSYHRTHLLDNMSTQSVADNTSPYTIEKGKTFAFVSGSAGRGIRGQDRCLPTTPPYGCSGEWANLYTSSQGGTHGALFCEFYVDGDPEKANCYFKDKNGNVPDSFTIFSAVEGPPPTPSSTPTAGPSPTPSNTPTPTQAPTNQSIRVAAGSDDAEEKVSSGSVNLTSSDLELVTDGNNVQEVGMRFTGVNIPNSATVTSATIQFTTDETASGQTDVTFYAEDVDDAVTFSNSNSNISSRPKTTARVDWLSVPAWNTVGEAGPNQKTPNLAAVVQEVVDRAGWSAGNDLTIYNCYGYGQAYSRVVQRCAG